MSSQPPSLSVVVPTFNRVDRLRIVVEALTTQTVRPDEIIIVSDGSTDGTDDYLSGIAADRGVTALKQANAGAAEARNTGVDAARGEIILFIDDDLVPTCGLVAEHVKCHVGSGPNAVVIGPMLDPPGYEFTPWTAWEQQMLRKQYDAMEQGLFAPTPRQFYTANASVRRELFQAVGGFDPSFRRMEDVELAWRLADRGATWVFAEEAIGWHYAERSFSSWLAIGDAYGHNDVKFGRDQARGHVLTTIVAEYGRRKIALRSVLQLTLRSKVASRALRQSAEFAATNSWTARRERLVRAALSCAYNDAYYHGVTDELGGLERFRELMGWTR